MGFDLYIERGNGKNREEYCEDMGSNSGFLSWKYKMAEREGYNLYEPPYFENKYKGKYPMIFNHNQEYTVEELPEALKELYEIKKLNIPEHRTAMCFKTTDKGLSFVEKKSILSEDTYADKLIRICEKALEWKVPIKGSY
jgi:hypothetical protein